MNRCTDKLRSEMDFPSATIIVIVNQNVQTDLLAITHENI